MSAPSLQIDLDKIFHNASTLVERLKAKGISVTGVTKAFLGAPQIANTMLRAGVRSLGDSRIENIEGMRQSGIEEQIMLIRSPMLSQTDRVVASADVSFNTELNVLSALSKSAVKAGKTHGVVLMIELGDLREGILPEDVEMTVHSVRNLSNIKFLGLGSNLACRSGVSPDNKNMAELSFLAAKFAQGDHLTTPLITGGNSSNLNWALNGGSLGRINNLRLGESILLGREPLNRQPIAGLFTDCISLVTEVIESKVKPSKPWGTIAQSAFGEPPCVTDKGDVNQLIVAIGRQDIDPHGLTPPSGFDILSASSDHLVLDSGKRKLAVGSNVLFQLNYSAFLRAMTSPYVAKDLIGRGLGACTHPHFRELPDAA